MRRTLVPVSLVLAPIVWTGVPLGCHPGPATAPTTSTSTSAPASAPPVGSASSAKPKISLTGGLLLPDTAGSTPPDDPTPSGPGPACAKDEDCWSKTCCPATQPHHCVHASLAKHCALKDVSCKPAAVTFTCVCEAGACKGRPPG